ncbi:unnamed protein product [Pocillopora meandrina]|uniref:Uncharacterized protein n=1 Tax=Pocillopora meandrina TaxID=46732 RepID=A0AAU9Y388_9CNID|nr:unnamed protein product [Pocillopora meandrina]
MKTLAVSSKSYQEDRSIDAISKEQEREFCNNCGKQSLRNKCGKANHWQSVCRFGKRKQFKERR